MGSLGRRTAALLLLLLLLLGRVEVRGVVNVVWCSRPEMGREEEHVLLDICQFVLFVAGYSVDAHFEEL